MKHFTSSKEILLLSLVFCCMQMTTSVYAQDNVGIGTNTPNASAILELLSTNKGMLVPRMNTIGMTSIPSPANSLLVYNTDSMCYFFYRLPSLSWISLCNSGSGSGSNGATGSTGPTGVAGAVGSVGATGATGSDLGTHWTITGNAGTVAGTNFIGTTDAADFVTKTNGSLPANERMRVLSAGNVIINNTTLGVNTGDVFSVYSNGTTNGSTTNTSALGNSAINGYSSGTGNGIFGLNTATGTGVYGLNTAIRIGVEGDVFNIIPQPIATGTSMGVFGYNNSVPSAGAYAVGVLGSAVSTTGPTDGVYGRATSASGYGTTGFNANTSGTGVVGIGNNLPGNILVAGSGGAFTGIDWGVYAINTSFGTSGAIYTDNGGVINRYNYFNGTQYKINGTGTVSTTVKDVNGKDVVMHCPETPEIYFSDYGQGQLINGKAHIDMDPTFAKNVTINSKHPLRIFTQLEGDCNGVYITNKTTSGFDVIELKGGTSNTYFQWNVVCNAADQEVAPGKISKNADVRFEAAPLPEKTEKRLNHPTGIEPKRSK